MMFEHDGVVYAKYCLYGELYYTPYEIYGDDPDKSEKAMTRMANSAELLSLCDSAPSFEDNPMLCSELEYDQQIIKMNQLLAFQGVLENYHNIDITEIKLQEAQAPLNPSIRRPAIEDWERKRKYFENVSANVV